MLWHAWSTALRSRLQPVLAQGQARWRGLSRRERQQVIAMAVVVAVAAVWLLLAKPALDTLQHWSNELPRLRSQAAALKEVLADVDSPTAALGDASVEQRLRASLDAAGLAGAYRLREADAAWQIEFEGAADVPRVMAWLLNAPARLGMAVQQVTLQRSEGRGSSGPMEQVRARATVTVQRKTGNGS
ncbi:type II secretion system protein GspM [Variovorax sp. LT1R16]|uniref:type II secretion system protein GspM n=1 Tax=Variovorax sp. LT1R16 TaxID=3443728 RepID=UPI003F4572E7